MVCVAVAGGGHSSAGCMGWGLSRYEKTVNVLDAVAAAAVLRGREQRVFAGGARQRLDA